MIRLALIGTGPWGRNYVHSALEAGNCKVTHVAGEPRGRSDLTSLKVVGSREWRLLLDAPVDAFIVATPPDTHAEIACALLNAGRPVMIEKPLALTYADAVNIQLAGEKTGTPWMVAHQHLFSTAYEELLDRVSGWSWCSVASAGGNDGPHRSYSALWDYGPHDISMFLGLQGDRGGKTRVNRVRLIGGMYTMSLIRKNRFADHVGTIRLWNNRGPKTRLFTVMGDSGVAIYDGTIPCNDPSDRPLARALRSFAGGGSFNWREDWRMSKDFGVEVVNLLEVADIAIDDCRFTGIDCVR